MTTRTLTLSDLTPGAKAIIINADRAYHLLRRRLTDFGVMEGSNVSMIKKLPFGGPIEIECNGQLLALRRKDCRAIEVKVQ